jgi:hypothetical protein
VLLFVSLSLFLFLFPPSTPPHRRRSAHRSNRARNKLSAFKWWRANSATRIGEISPVWGKNLSEQMLNVSPLFWNQESILRSRFTTPAL